MAAAASVVLAASALAAPRFESEVTIDFSAATKQGPSNASFFGRVKSEKNACERRRKVTLYYKANGADFSTEMGSDKTNAKGKWIVESVPVMDGSYFATVKAKEIRAGLCKGDTSPNVAFTR